MIYTVSRIPMMLRTRTCTPNLETTIEYTVHNMKKRETNLTRIKLEKLKIEIKSHYILFPSLYNFFKILKLKVIENVLIVF